MNRAIRLLVLTLSLTQHLLACGGASLKDSSSGNREADPRDGGKDAMAPTDGALSEPAPTGQDVGGLRIVSVPPTFVLQHGTYTYRPRTNATEEPAWSIKEGPAGATFADGRLSFDASATGMDTQELHIEAQVGPEVRSQRFNVVVGTSQTRAAATVSPTSSGHVAVSAPLSPIRGAAITLPAGALRKAAEITVGEVDHTPTFLGGADSPTPVVFGPSGLSFPRPVTLSLPYDPRRMTDASKLGGYGYDPETGRWRPLPILDVDDKNGVVLALARHFSLYMAASSDVELVSDLLREPSAGNCPGAIRAHVRLATALDQVAASHINNPSTTLQAFLRNTSGGSIADLLRSGAFRGTLRAVYVLELNGGTQLAALETELLVAGLYLESDGSATVRHVDGSGNLLFEASFKDVSASWDEISAHLRGVAFAARFSPHAEDPLGLSMSVHWVASEGDTTREGLAESDIGPALVERILPAAALPPAPPDLDRDCDRLTNTYDRVDNRGQPQLQVQPATATTVLVGQPLRLQTQVIGAAGMPLTAAWTADDDAIDLAIEPTDPGTSARIFSVTKAGRYRVQVVIKIGEASLEHAFLVDALPSPAKNTAPLCLVTAATGVIAAGETLDLQAEVYDRESPGSALQVRWGQVDRSASSPQLAPLPGLTVVAPLSARLDGLSVGRFELGCVASDGQAESSLGEDGFGKPPTAAVEVIDPSINVAPQDLMITPVVAQGLPGEPIRVTARGSDPNRELLSLTWSARTKGGEPVEAGALTQAAPPYLKDTSTTVGQIWFTPPGEGTYIISLRASDGAGLFLESEVRIYAVTMAAMGATTDADGDGYPPGSGALSDCEDQNADIHPEAQEICGNALDEDCDGLAKVSDCDSDGFTADQGAKPDCDDTDPRTNPAAKERCDGSDNNCDGQVDEGFAVGSTCGIGVGACRTSGKLQCASDGTRAACVGTPLPPKTEVCDRTDNDCDGAVDEGGVCDVVCEKGAQDYDHDAVCQPACAADFCTGHGTCDDRSGTALCSCSGGYTGSRCQQCATGFQDNDRNGLCGVDCAHAGLSCGSHGSCDDASGEARCRCDFSYTGSGCDRCDLGFQDNDKDGYCLPDCSSEACSGHGTCDDSAGVKRCACEPAYSGTFCYLCNTGFEDADGDGDCEVICPDGYARAADDLTCEDVNECAIARGGCAQTCTNLPGSFACACGSGYQLAADGRGCNDDNECATANGGCAQTCTNLPGSFACACDAGYKLAADGHGCDDIDECVTANGGCAQRCSNLPGSFVCGCEPGFTLNPDGASCDDVDECAAGNGGCQQLCTNTVGGFTCGCAPEFVLNQDGVTCSDVDECATGNGGCEQVCINFSGGFTCACGPGSTLDPDGFTCNDIDECVTNNGGCEQTCDNSDGGYSCGCVEGFTLNGDGHACDDVDECTSGNGGCEQVCINFPGDHACACAPGFLLNDDGFSCTDVDECADGSAGCEQGCTNTPGGFSCSCDLGFTLNQDGSSCDDVDECAVDNGGCPGSCSNTPGSFSCSCGLCATVAYSGNVEAQQKCPTVCSGEGYAFTGQWTNGSLECSPNSICICDCTPR